LPLPPPPSLLLLLLLAAAQPQLTVACHAAASAMLARKTPNANQPSTWHSSATSARLPTHVQHRRPSQAQQEPATSGTWRQARGRAYGEWLGAGSVAARVQMKRENAP
jgi:hypothetical protein